MSRENALMLVLHVAICIQFSDSGQSRRRTIESFYDIAYSARVVGKYATYRQTLNWYAILEARHPDIVRLLDIGRTVEGRKQVVMRLSPRPTDDLPVIFVESLMHAREWLAGASVNYVIHKMILRYKAGVSRYRSALNRYIFYFLSISNPDGYAFTFKNASTYPNNRFWRKNRRINRNGCIGVDLNRNWNIDFSGSGSSTDPCSISYRGLYPFSEPETDNIRRFMQETIGVGRLTLYLAVHSFSQLILVPWCHTREKARNYRELRRAASYASFIVKRETGREYRVEDCSGYYDPSSGASDDWALANMRAKYSYTLECGPTKAEVRYNYRVGYNPHTSRIPSSGHEVLLTILSLVDAMNPY